MSTVFIGQLIRKILSAFLGAAILTLVNAGVLTQGSADQWLETTGAIVAFALIACWTNWIWPWIRKLLNR